jgi:hypothetical protein
MAIPVPALIALKKIIIGNCEKARKKPRVRRPMK